ncbi:cyclopropane-fatty-acyl-phospholipid synthase [Caulobacter sp. Root656]|jgi:cyclopropane-fatty-acyl-phospholipid synthase|uniref:SAM-dependent methyltransferase n=1 Tax=Caulobacter TaxID=75 RepID=UPI0006FA9944|nr:MULTISPECIES: cyclopropane-fatty-acyl-phospholipid synthase family protein [Caulobacter]KQZ28340.1 cyclopropane-fatty-acyl-phospholipid synthase [Caulobacter sp. Root1472]KRA67012.1 cyclopropane-fatty-acyl-phospholipid synthase [Caulobacter sp. Root656]GGL10072.1 cyclopropane-fatty-acyl-phospholipid synthase [Caulobacter rhizosphaerae]
MNDLSHAALAPAPRRQTLFHAFVDLLSANWTWGELTIVERGGARHHLVGKVAGPQAVLQVRDLRFAARVLASGDIGFAEGYIAGEWTSPDLAALLEVLANNYDHIRRLFDGGWWMKAVNWAFHHLRANSKSGARRNIHAHYDLGNDFYAAWLDQTMTYSAARFTAPDQSLEVAQRAKYMELARLIDLQPGHSLVEIGCGWGGFGLFAAGEIGARVQGVTISRAQYDLARRRVFEAGLSERVDIRLLDYRELDGQFDRLASIEMFEAVGKAYWGIYFQKVRDLLKPGGRAGLQVITIADALFEEYDARTDFIQRYVFPGGALASETHLADLATRHGLAPRRTVRFGLDYAETLRRWSERFEDAAATGVLGAMDLDERFRRLWRFYLAYCEAGFRTGRTNVIQFSLDRHA